MSHGLPDSLIKFADGLNLPVTFSTPSTPDFGLLYFNEPFLELSGYKPEDIRHRNCRFMQGEYVNQKNSGIMRRCLMSGVDVSVPLVNVRANGEVFPNLVFLHRLVDLTGDVVAIMGCQYDLSKGCGDEDVEDYVDILNDAFLEKPSARPQDRLLVASRLRLTQAVLDAANALIGDPGTPEAQFAAHKNKNLN
jgi:PAS domain S-box-containing protein